VIAQYKEIEISPQSRHSTPEIQLLLQKISNFVQNETKTIGKTYLPVHAIDLSADGQIGTMLRSDNELL
jgi:hypothetical protein